MTPAELAAIEARANAATPGPWRVEHWDDAGRVHAAGAVDTIAQCGGTGDWDDVDGPNAAFIAAARSDVPALLAEVKRLTALLPPYARTQSFAIWVEEHQRLKATLDDVVSLVRNPTTTLEEIRAYIERLQKLRDG